MRWSAATHILQTILMIENFNRAPIFLLYLPWALFVWHFLVYNSKTFIDIEYFCWYILQWAFHSTWCISVCAFLSVSRHHVSLLPDKILAWDRCVILLVYNNSRNRDRICTEIKASNHKCILCVMESFNCVWCICRSAGACSIDIKCVVCCVPTLIFEHYYGIIVINHIA